MSEDKNASSEEVRLDAHVRGDFQTPPDLAAAVWTRLGESSEVKVAVEPTVGAGAFLRAAPDALLAARWICWDLDSTYVEQARAVARERGFACAEIRQRDAFDISTADFAELDTTKPVLVIGNPPWVTSAGQGRSKAQNLPEKSNAQFGLAGLDAITGKANFDIAEAILLRVLEALTDFDDVRIAFLLKKSVALKLSRKLLGVASCLSFEGIDARSTFGVAVDAGLFVATLKRGDRKVTDYVTVAPSLGGEACRKAGFWEGRFVEDLDRYRGAKHLEATDPVPWRQGVKHDLAKVLELIPREGGYENGLGEVVAIEDGVLCPLYKSSDIAHGREARRLFPLFQVDLSGPLPDLATRWPRLWDYLCEHDGLFEARRSRIYANKQPFSIFGIGPYTLAPWKVAVSGLYPTAQFRVLGPSAGRPPLVDDTCYLLPFENEEHARQVAAHLNDSGPQNLIQSLMDSKAKRPITKALLARIGIPESPPDHVEMSQFTLLA